MEKLKPQKASQSACLMETIKPRFYRRFSLKSYFLSLSHQGVKHDYRMELSGTLYFSDVQAENLQSTTSEAETSNWSLLTESFVRALWEQMSSREHRHRWRKCMHVCVEM